MIEVGKLTATRLYEWRDFRMYVYQAAEVTKLFFLFSLITHIVIVEVLFINESFYHPTLLADRFIATVFSVHDPF